MESPLDPLVADMVNVLDDNQCEDFEERAGIIEFDAMLPRGHAECLALLDVLRRHPAVLTGVITLRIELNGAPRCLLTTDVNHARTKLADIGGVELGIRDLAKLIKEQFEGVAMLTTIR
jgi:hypothetical protein